MLLLKNVQMKKVLVLPVIILCLLLSMGSLVASTGLEVSYGEGDGEWIGNVWYIGLYPGEYKETFMEVENISSGSLDVEMSVSSCCLTCITPRNFTLRPGGIKKVYLVARAPGDISPGTYNVTWSAKVEKIGTPITTPQEGEEEEGEQEEEEEAEEEVEELEEEEEQIDEPEEEDIIDEVGTRSQWPEMLAVILVACFAALWFFYLIRERKKKQEKESK